MLVEPTMTQPGYFACQTTTQRADPHGCDRVTDKTRTVRRAIAAQAVVNVQVEATHAETMRGSAWICSRISGSSRA